MNQRSLDGTDLTERRRRYRALVEERLPAAADPDTWPIHADHCFARIVLDNVFGGEWTAHVPGRPAYEHLSPRELATAIDLAEGMLTRGAPLVKQLNRRSLQWRENDD